MLESRPLILSVTLLVTLVAAAAASAAATTTPAATLPTAATTPAAVVRIDGQIDDYARDQLKLRFGRAKAAGAKVIILEIDTYGGLVTSGLDVSRFLKNQQDVRVIAFVNSKAISAGAMIALACDEIVMTPSGTLGDCAPIQSAPGVGVVPMDATERSKAESPVLADFRESAARRGHPPLLALAMVSLPYSAHWVEDGAGHRKFVDADEYKKLTEAGGWKPVAGEASPVDGPETLLTVHTEQAVRFGLAGGTATSAADLAARRNLNVVARYESGFGDQVVALLASPIARGLLLVVFVNALFIALKVPGTGGPEMVAVLALGLMVGAPVLTGYAGWLEAMLILGGVALILLEVFVAPGTVVAAAGGGLMLLTGVVLTFVGDAWSIPGGWSLPQTWDALQRGIQVTVLGLAASMLLFAWLRARLPTMPYFNRLILSPTTDGRPAAVPMVPPVVALVTGPLAGGKATAADAADCWPFVGTIGSAVSDLKPGGTVRFPYADDTRVTSVVTEGGYIRAGTKVAVREVRGNHVVVRNLG